MLGLQAHWEGQCVQQMQQRTLLRPIAQQLQGVNGMFAQATAGLTIIEERTGYCRGNIPDCSGLW